MPDPADSSCCPSIEGAKADDEPSAATVANAAKPVDCGEEIAPNEPLIARASRPGPTAPPDVDAVAMA